MFIRDAIDCEAARDRGAGVGAQTPRERRVADDSRDRGRERLSVARLHE